jgi:hypothetical protein
MDILNTRRDSCPYRKLNPIYFDVDPVAWSPYLLRQSSCNNVYYYKTNPKLLPEVFKLLNLVMIKLVLYTKPSHRNSCINELWAQNSQIFIENHHYFPLVFFENFILTAKWKLQTFKYKYYTRKPKIAPNNLSGPYIYFMSLCNLYT